MEQSFVKEHKEYFLNLGFTEFQMERIIFLMEKAIEEKLYVKNKDYFHDLKHIERVLVYLQLILNQRIEKENENLLFWAGLYHDIGRTLGATGEDHGKVGSEEFVRRMAGILDTKTIEVISFMIEQHSVFKMSRFTNPNFSKSEQRKIEQMTFILRDADALDRNRLGTCDITYLRTPEAKNLLSFTNDFLKTYQEFSKSSSFLKK